MRIHVIASACLICLSACVADPETKIASTQTAVALASLDESEESFRRLYFQEVDKTRELVKRSLVARAVVYKVTEVANDLEAKGDLLTLSIKIEEEEAAVRGLIDEVEDLQTTESQTVAAHSPSVAILEGEGKDNKKEQNARKQLDELVNKKRQDILGAAQLFPSDHPTRKELEAKAAAANVISQRILDQLFVLMQLKAMRMDAEKGLHDLRDYITSLQKVHSTIDQWIQMDVKASGEDIAKLVDEHAKTLGLARER